MTLTIRREMTITHADFFRLLPLALRNREYTISGGRISVQDPVGTIVITLSPEQTKIIASLSLPVTDVAIYFDSMPDREVESFLKEFDRSYQKGGG